MTDLPPAPIDGYDTAGADVLDCARQAQDAVRRLAHLTLRAPSLTPAEVDTVLSHLAETVAALPQIAGQLASILDRSRETHLLAMDSMTPTTDPDLAIDTARLHLDDTRGPAVATYRHLNAARNQVAHISATAITDTDTEDVDRGPHPSPIPRRPEGRQPPSPGRNRGMRGPAR
jgi:hypothetical protein